MLEIVEGWWFAEFLRRSIWAYPIVNAMHILALGALVTSALVMDVRILGGMRRLSVAEVTGLLRPVAIGALALAVGTGFLLFTVRPHDYAGTPVFLIKLGLLALAVANAALFVLAKRDRAPQSPLTRTMAVFSVLLWLGVLMAGRLIGFLE